MGSCRIWFFQLTYNATLTIRLHICHQPWPVKILAHFGYDAFNGKMIYAYIYIPRVQPTMLVLLFD